MKNVISNLVGDRNFKWWVKRISIELSPVRVRYNLKMKSADIMYRFGYYNYPHRIIFLAGMAVSYFLFLKKNFGQLFSVLVKPLLIALGLFSLQHLWELLMESWKVFILTDALIEGTEKVIILPAFILAERRVS